MINEKTWASFWRCAGTHGCTEGFPPNAQAKLAADWRAIFIGMQAQPVLDIACGRGALHAHASAAGAPINAWLGVDFAEIEGTPFAFRGGIDAAALPFADAAFPLVVSQFGLEYAGLMPAVAEAARVCTGQLVALLHAAEGAPCAHAHEQLDQIGWLEAQAFAARLYGHFEAPRPETAADIDNLLAAIVARAAPDANTSLLEAVWRQVIAMQEDSRQTLAAALDLLVTGLASHRSRLDSMLAAAPDAPAAAAAAAKLRTLGFSARLDDARLQTDDGPVLIGRWLIAERTEGET